MSSSPPSSRSRLLAIGAAALVVVAAVIAIVASRGGDDGSATSTTAAANTGSGASTDTAAAGTIAEYQHVTVSGAAPIAPFAEESPDPVVGTAVPTLTGKSFDGTAVTIPTAGKATLVVFLAHWCPHCQRELPLLSTWYTEGKVPAGVDLVGVATSTTTERPNYPPSAWIESEKVQFPVLVDNDKYEAGAAYGLTGFPYFVLVGADGTVKLRLSGEIDPADLGDMVTKALGAAA